MLFWSAFSTTGGLPSGQLRHQLHPAVGLVSTGECRGVVQAAAALIVRRFQGRSLVETGGREIAGPGKHVGEPSARISVIERSSDH